MSHAMKTMTRLQVLEAALREIHKENERLTVKLKTTEAEVEFLTDALHRCKTEILVSRLAEACSTHQNDVQAVS